MTNLITNLSNWLTSSHSIELIGWQWIVALPAALIILAATIFFLTVCNIGKIILPW